MFLKIVHKTANNIVLDVFDTLSDNIKYVKWNEDIKDFEVSNLINGDGIVSSDSKEVYCFGSNDGFKGYEKEYKYVSLVEIFQDEYDYLKEIIKDKFVNVNGKILEMEDILENKIKELSENCEKKIIKGVDLIMSDNKTHHFSFELSDQIKISKLYNKANNNETFLPYHADGELCKNFAIEDIMKLNTVMENIIEYHISYFNSLKLYLLNLANNQKSIVYNAYYGMEIPEEFQSEILVKVKEDIKNIKGLDY